VVVPRVHLGPQPWHRVWLRHVVALKGNYVNDHTFESPISDDIWNDVALPRGVPPLTTEDEKSYKVVGPLCRRVDRNLAKDICRTITVRNTRRDWLKKCNSSALKLIPMLMRRLDEIGPIANNAAAARIAELLSAGPGERTMASWNTFREEFDLWNATQSIYAQIVGPLLAQKYAAAACQLGSPLDSDIRNEIRALNAKGDPEKTLEAITTAISEYEALN
jgi:hypothetical protein